MRTFNLLGGQVVIDEGKEKYHELMVVGENIRREIYSLIKADFQEKHMNGKAVTERIIKFKQSYIIRYSNRLSEYISQKYKTLITGDEIIFQTEVTRNHRKKQI